MNLPATFFPRLLNLSKHLHVYTDCFALTYTEFSRLKLKIKPVFCCRMYTEKYVNIWKAIMYSSINHELCISGYKSFLFNLSISGGGGGFCFLWWGGGGGGGGGGVCFAKRQVYCCRWALDLSQDLCNDRRSRETHSERESRERLTCLTCRKLNLIRN